MAWLMYMWMTGFKLIKRICLWNHCPMQGMKYCIAKWCNFTLRTPFRHLEFPFLEFVVELLWSFHKKIACTEDYRWFSYGTYLWDVAWNSVLPLQCISCVWSACRCFIHRWVCPKRCFPGSPKYTYIEMMWMMPVMRRNTQICTTSRFSNCSLAMGLKPGLGSLGGTTMVTVTDTTHHDSMCLKRFVHTCMSCMTCKPASWNNPLSLTTQAICLA